MTALRQRVVNCLLGAGLGEAMSWPSLFTRSYQLPAWPRRILRELSEFGEREALVRLPMPFSLNQPAEVFDLSPSAGTEWMMFTASVPTGAGDGYQQERVLERWLELAGQEGVRGTVGVMTALDNLRKGLRPPVSGHDNPHYMDDSAMVRAVAIGARYAGRQEAAAAAAEFDASITNAEDGILGATAVARGIARACGGAPVDDTIDEAIAALPENSWIGRTVRLAVARTRAGGPSPGNGLAALPSLHDLVNREYSYAGIACESLAVTLAVLKLTRGDFAASLLVAGGIPKCAESVPMLVGAFAGALDGGDNVIPPAWRPPLTRLRGVALPAMRAYEFINGVEEIASNSGTGMMR